LALPPAGFLSSLPDDWQEANKIVKLKSDNTVLRILETT
jgi:hypothetical protein